MREQSAGVFTANVECWGHPELSGRTQAVCVLGTQLNVLVPTVEKLGMINGRLRQVRMGARHLAMSSGTTLEARATARAQTLRIPLHDVHSARSSFTVPLERPEYPGLNPRSRLASSQSPMALSRGPRVPLEIWTVELTKIVTSHSQSGNRRKGWN